MNGICNYLYPYYGKARGYLHYYLPDYSEFDLTEILPNLYVGNIGSAFHKEKMQELGITHVVCAIKGTDAPFPDDFKYLNIEAIDIEEEDLLTEFNRTSEFIDQCLNNSGKCLVHCVCGVSRSVSIICAYLLYKNKARHVQEAINMVQTKRQIANPNLGFRQQLENYRISLYRKSPEIELIQHK